MCSTRKGKGGARTPDSSGDQPVPQPAVKLKSGEYCKTYGERSCADDEVLDLMEANDNHSETHTVGEFI